MFLQTIECPEEDLRLSETYSDLRWENRTTNRPPRRKTDWKYPVPLLVTCCGSKSLKVILIDSDFGYYPLLNPLVTL